MRNRLAAALAALILAGSLAACTQGAAPSPGTAPTPGAPAGPAPASPTDAAEPQPDSPVSLAIKKIQDREYSIYGHTAQATGLKIHVEDGHNMLFGPAEVPVTDGRFRIDFMLDESAQDRAFAYIAGEAGAELAVVPFDLAQDLTTFGAPFDVTDVPPLPGEQQTGGDKRTNVTAEGIESPHFKLKWPDLTEGTAHLRITGETDLSGFWAEIRNGDDVLQHVFVGGEQNGDGKWHEFQANIEVPGEGGFRADYAVVLLGPAETDVELYFQPIRN